MKTALIIFGITLLVFFSINKYPDMENFFWDKQMDIQFPPQIVIYEHHVFVRDGDTIRLPHVATENWDEEIYSIIDTIHHNLILIEGTVINGPKPWAEFAYLYIMGECVKHMDEVMKLHDNYKHSPGIITREINQSDN